MHSVCGSCVKIFTNFKLIKKVIDDRIKNGACNCFGLEEIENLWNPPEYFIYSFRK